MLWNRGYFAGLFFHTRFQPYLYFTLTYILIGKNFEKNLKKNELYSYYLKKESTDQVSKIAKNFALKQEIKKEKVINELQNQNK